ncbi:MAG: carboxypeptidase M32, partial [Leptothrix sp. (in: b-proteobacteria)]
MTHTESVPEPRTPIDAAATPAYAELEQRQARLHRLEHLGSIVSWDQSANMPPKGNEARAAAMAELEALLHGHRTDAALPGLLQRAEQEALSDWQRANLREIRRDWLGANALPAALVEQRALATARCE